MFTENFVNLLQKNDMTAYAVAKGTGISQGTMGEYRSGKKKPSIENLVKIADFLNVSTDFLLGREQKSENNSAPDDEVRSAISADETKTAIASVKMLVTSDGLVKTVMYQDQAEAVRDLIAMLEPNELSEVELFAEFLISKRHKKEFVIDPDFVNA